MALNIFVMTNEKRPQMNPQRSGNNLCNLEQKLNGRHKTRHYSAFETLESIIFPFENPLNRFPDDEEKVQS